MGTHPDGTGTGWDACEAVDVDQPEGLDYRYVVHVAKAVRKRNNKEHEAYADTTAGGEHLPGGCRVLGIIDATADLTAAAGDASHDVTTAKFIGRGIFYDQTSNVLWCMTNSDGTTTGDPYALMWGPKSICLGADYSWTGTHEFSDVDISGSLDLTGHFACGSEVVGEISASFSGEVDISQTLNCASAANVAGGLVVDGTAVFTSEVDISGNADISGTLNFDTLGTGNAYDTSWFEVSNDCTTGYSKTHNLGSTALQITMFCCSKGGADYSEARVMPNGMIDGDGGRQQGGVVAEISTTTFNVFTAANYALPLRANVLGSDATGYYRVIATRLI